MSTGHPIRDFVRDAFFGDVARLIGPKLFPYPEEQPGFVVPEHLTRQPSSSRPISRSSTHTATGDEVVKKGDDRKALALSEKPNEIPSDDQAEKAQLGVQQKDSFNDPNLVDWYSDTDPENPRNWSFFKKCYVTAMICLLTFAIYVGSAIYTPGVQLAARYFGVSDTASTLGLTIFVIGYGVGPLILSPLSEIPSIGRTKPYIVTLFLFVVLQIPTALATDFGVFLFVRFFAGFFGSPPLATGGATLQDIWEPKYVGYSIGIWGLSAVCGPVLGPVMAGFAVEAEGAEGWRWSFWELLWLSGFALLWLIFSLPETSSSNILHKRAVRLRKLTGNQELKSYGDIIGASMTPKDIAVMTLVRPFTLMLEPIVFFLNLYIAFLYSILYLWFEAFPLTFIKLHGFTIGTLGLAYMGIFIGVLVAYVGYCIYLKYHFEPLFDRYNGKIPPEKRLPAACVGSVFIPIAMFWFGWSARPDVHWIMPIIGSGLFAVGTFLMFQSVLTYLGDAYATYAASAYAGNDVFRSVMGGCFPIFGVAFFTNLGLDWGSSLLGFIGLAMVPIPFVLYRYGARIRKWSKMADSDQ